MRCACVEASLVTVTMTLCLVSGCCWGASSAGPPSSELIETSNGYASDRQVAVNAAGDAVAVWSQYDDSRSRIYANRYVAGTGWSGAVELGSVPNGGSYALDVAVNASGSAVAVWLWTDGSVWEMRANRFNPLESGVGGWGGAVLVGTGTRLTFDSTGAVITAWESIFTTLFDLMANLYVPGVGWGTRE